MIIYSDDIKNSIDANIDKLIIGSNYMFKGLYGKYVTDVDIHNDIDDYSQVGDTIKDNINRLPNSIKFVYLTSGVYPSFNVPWNIINLNFVENYDYDQGLKFAQSLFDKQLININQLSYIKKNLPQKPNGKKLLLIEDMLSDKRKVRWTKGDIEAGYKVIDGEKVGLQDSLNRSPTNVLHFIYLKDGSFIPIDVGLVNNTDVISSDKQEPKPKKFNRYFALKYLHNEYYYIVQDFARFLKKDKQLSKKLRQLVIDDYGVYRQLLMNLFYLVKFSQHNIVSQDMFVQFVEVVVQDIKNHTDFSRDKLVKLEEVVGKLKSGDLSMTDEVVADVLNKIKEELFNHLNSTFKPYVKQYMGKLDSKLRKKLFKIGMKI